MKAHGSKVDARGFKKHGKLVKILQIVELLILNQRFSFISGQITDSLRSALSLDHLLS